MREHGRYQIQLMKTRSSSGVGMKIDLEFNIDTLRITDLEEADDGIPASRGTSIMDSIRQKSNVERAADPELGAAVKPFKAQVESSKLRQLLGNLPQGLP
jgi:hypothetical protein